MPREVAEPAEVFREGVRCRLEVQLAVGEKTNRDSGRVGAHPSVETIAIYSNVICFSGRAHVETTVSKFEEAPATAGVRRGKLSHAIVDATLDYEHLPAEVPGKRLDC
jgi:hypothetical protein